MEDCDQSGNGAHTDRRILVRARSGRPAFEIDFPGDLQRDSGRLAGHHPRECYDFQVRSAAWRCGNACGDLIDARNLPMIIFKGCDRWTVAHFAMRPGETGKVVDFASVGPWRSWERVSMASRRSWVRIPSAPPITLPAFSRLHPAECIHKSLLHRPNSRPCRAPGISQRQLFQVVEESRSVAPGLQARILHARRG